MKLSANCQVNGNGYRCVGLWVNVQHSYIGPCADRGLVVSDFSTFILSHSVIADCTTSENGAGCYASGTTVIIDRTCFVADNSETVGQACHLVPSSYGSMTLCAASLCSGHAYCFDLDGNDWDTTNVNSSFNTLSFSTPTIYFSPAGKGLLTHFQGTKCSCTSYVCCLGYSGEGEVTCKRSNFIGNEQTGKDATGLSLTAEKATVDACFISPTRTPIFILMTGYPCNYLVQNCIFDAPNNEQIAIGTGCQWNCPEPTFIVNVVYFDGNACLYPSSKIFTRTKQNLLFVALLLI